ncbi:MAG TPA: IPT/TIG domain-containing protein [Thermoplasmata archaeon]|nr:IPT/TIG domain-containing protein [Thermoplasmata archaeon]
MPKPEIVSVSPSSGPVQGGTAVNLSGFNFTAGATVRFGVYDATNVNVLDAYTISASTPANIPGSADIAILDPPNSDNLVAEGSLPGGFTYTGNALPPRIRSITPNFGTATTSTNVTVEGDYFVAGATLSFDGVECASYSVVDPRTVAATVQPLPLAVYDVTVTNPDGGNDTLVNGFETTSYAASDVESPFDGVASLNVSLAIVDDFAIMDLYVFANVTHTPYYWAGVRLELESPSGRRVMVFDQIIATDSTGTTWRSGFSSVFGYDEAPSEVLWQLRGERALGNWTLHLSSAPGVAGSLHSWGLYLFKYRQREIAKTVFVAAEFRNYVAAFDEATGDPIYRVHLEAQNSPVAFPMTVAVSRDQRYACGGAYTAYNATRVGWTDSAITCFNATTGRKVGLFSFSGHLNIDGIEAAANADRLVAATEESLYLIDTTTLQIAGMMPLLDDTGPPHLGLTADGRKAYVASPGKQRVLVVDLDAMAVVAQIDTPGYDLGDVDIASDGTFGILSTSGSPSALLKFDATTDAIVDTLTIPGFASQSVLSPNNSKAFYTQFQWYAGFGRLDLGGAAWRGFMPHPESTTQGIAMGRDGFLYVADWAVQRIWVYNSSTETLVREIEVPDRPWLRGVDVGELAQGPALTASGGSGSVTLSWVTPRSYGTPISGYTIYRGDRPGEEVWLVSVGPTNTYVDVAVTNGATYYYRVAAVNGAGEGAPSNEAAATPTLNLPEITNVAATPNPQIAGGRVNITATVTSGPPVSGVWANVSDPGGGYTNLSMARLGASDSFYREATYALLGGHAFVIWAVNADGVWNRSQTSSFTILADAQPPQLSQVRADPDPQSVGGYVNVTADALDDLAVSTVWVNVSLPGGGTSNAAMVRIGSTNSFYHIAPYSTPGLHTYVVWASDSTGNTNSSSGHFFTIVDGSPPQITNVQDSPDPQAVGGQVNITATVTDDVGVAGVWLNVSLPQGGSTNATMMRVGLTDSYYSERGYWAPGIYSYRVSSDDAAGNWAASPVYSFAVVDTSPPGISNVQDAPDPQSVGSGVNITATVSDDVQVDLVSVNLTLPGGGYVNTSLVRIGLTDAYFLEAAYATPGVHTYHIWAADSSGNLNVSSEYSVTIVDPFPPQITNLQDSPDPQEVGGDVNITATVTDIQVDRVWVNLTLPGGGYVNTSLARVGLTDAYFFEATYANLGTHAYQVGAADAWGNVRTAAGAFLVQDLRKPELRNVQATPRVQETPGRVNISLTITDNHAVFPTVWIRLVDPLGTAANRTMMKAAGDVWFLNGTYSWVGTYAVTVSARDSVDNWNWTSSTFRMEDRTPPVAVGGADQDVLTGDSVLFDGSGSSDGAGPVANYTWRIVRDSTAVATLYAVSAAFAFASSGEYTVTLLVTDASGNVGEDSFTVTVRDSAPPQGHVNSGALFLVALLVVLVAAFAFYRRERPPPNGVPQKVEAPPAGPKDAASKPAGEHREPLRGP